MHKVLRVAWREFKQTVMRKVFLFAIVGVPLMIVAIGVVAALVLISAKNPAVIGEVRIIAPDSAIIELKPEQASAISNWYGPISSTTPVRATG